MGKGGRLDDNSKTGWKFWSKSNTFHKFKKLIHSSDNDDDDDESNCFMRVSVCWETIDGRPA